MIFLHSKFILNIMYIFIALNIKHFTYLVTNMRRWLWCKERAFLCLKVEKDSKPKLVVGSAEGDSGHVDGKPRDAGLNHPKGFTVGDRGNIYIVDTMKMIIRKLSDAGVTTIAGRNWGCGEGHIDGHVVAFYDRVWETTLCC